MRKASLGTLFLTVFLDLVGFGIVVPFLPGVARDLGASDTVAASIAAAFSAMQFLFIPIWGRLSDRKGRRPVLLVSILANVIGMGLLGLANSLPLLLAARLWSGVATSNIAVAQAYIADVTTPETRARGMGMMGVAFGLGFILGPFIGGELGHIAVFGREGPLAAFAAAALSLLNFFLAIRFLPESLPVDARASAPARRASPLDLGALRAVAGQPGLLLVVVMAFFITFFFSGLEVTFRFFTADVFGMSVAGTGRVFAVVGLVAAITQGALIGPLTRRFGERQLLFVGLVVMSFGFLAIGGCRLTAGWTWTLFMLGCVAVPAGNGLSQPSLSSYTSRQAAAAGQGMALGVVQSLGALARTVGPIAGGALYDHVSPSAPYVTGAVGLFLVALTARGLPALRSDG